MIARLLIGSLEGRLEEIKRILAESKIKNPDPDLLYFPSDLKLGIAEARKIKMHFSLKPYSAKGRVVVMEDASVLTVEAQNALLKTLEEPPDEAILILGAPSDVKFLPTILSRCQIVILSEAKDLKIRESRDSSQARNDIEKLLTSTTKERFEYIENCKDKKEFLRSLVSYFHQNLASHLTSGNTNYKEFLKELLQAEEWAKANVNIRGILEYLMLKMPKK